MVSIDSILSNLSSSVDPLQKLVSGFAYLLGILFCWHGMKKLKEIADARAQSGGGKSTFVPAAYFLGGASLFFLPTMYDIARNTFWGAESPIAYTAWVQQFAAQYGASNVSVLHIIQFVGILWFIRGIVLLVQATEPGNQHGTKGLLFVLAGIFGMNIQYTFTLISSASEYITSHWFKGSTSS